MKKQLLIAGILALLGFGASTAIKVKQFTDQLGLAIADFKLPKINSGNITFPFSLVFTNPTTLTLPISSVIVTLFKATGSGWQKVGENINKEKFNITPGTSSIAVSPKISLADANPFSSIEQTLQLREIKYKVVIDAIIQGFKISEEKTFSIPLL